MRQVQDKRQAILDTTLNLISERGFHGTSMSQIAKQAKVSTGIIYHYFDSKDHLIVELHDAIMQKIGLAMMKRFDATQPLPDQIQQLLHSAIRYAVWHPQESAFIEQFKRSPYHHQVEKADVDEANAVVACFDQAKKARIIKDLPMEIIEIFTVDAATALAQKQMSGQIEVNDAVVDQVVAIAWEAIRVQQLG